MTDNLPTKPQRDARGYWLPGQSANPGGRPKKDVDIAALATEHTPQAFAKIVELLNHKDGRVALAAANSIIDRAFGKPAQSVQAKVETLDIAKLWLHAVSNPTPAKTIEVEAQAAQETRIVGGMITPLVEDGKRGDKW
jgi:hypothetical protein